MDKILVTVRVTLFDKPKVVWRKVRKDKQGEYVVIDRQKRYLSDMKKNDEFSYDFNYPFEEIYGTI